MGPIDPPEVRELYHVSKDLECVSALHPEYEQDYAVGTMLFLDISLVYFNVCQDVIEPFYKDIPHVPMWVVPDLVCKEMPKENFKSFVLISAEVLKVLNKQLRDCEEKLSIEQYKESLSNSCGEINPLCPLFQCPCWWTKFDQLNPNSQSTHCNDPDTIFDRSHKQQMLS